MDCFVASAPLRKHFAFVAGNDAWAHRHTFAFSRHDLPEVLQIVSPSSFRGRRECRMRAAPAVSCATCTKNMHMSIQGSGEHPTFPAQWLYGLWRDLPGRAVLVVTVVPWELSPLRSLTPAYRASGPHA